MRDKRTPKDVCGEAKYLVSSPTWGPLPQCKRALRNRALILPHICSLLNIEEITRVRTTKPTKQIVNGKFPVEACISCAF